MEPESSSAHPANPSPEPSTPTPEATHSLQCLEILGGNQVVRHALATPGMNVWIDSRPHAGTRGGDLHYVSMCGSGRVTRFIVADISGHGPDLDEFAQRLRNLVSRYINLLDQTRFARAINKHFAEQVGDSKFATVLLVTYFAPTHHLIVCNAGHPPPLWYSHAAGRWRYLNRAAADAGPSIRAERARYRLSRVANLPLGMIEPTPYRQFAAKLATGDVVVLYTDAMIEARNPAGQMLTSRGLLKLARRTIEWVPQAGNAADATARGTWKLASAAARLQQPEPADASGSTPSVDPPRTAQLIGQELIHAVYRWRGGRPPEDDQTTVVLHHNGESPPRLTLGRAARSMMKMLGFRWKQ